MAYAKANANAPAHDLDFSSHLGGDRRRQAKRDPIRAEDASPEVIGDQVRIARGCGYCL